MEALCFSGFGVGQSDADVGLLGAFVILEKPQDSVVWFLYLRLGWGRDWWEDCDNTEIEQLLEGVVNVQCLLSVCDIVLFFLLSTQLTGWHLESIE